jgi:hypothetical protein
VSVGEDVDGFLNDYISGHVFYQPVFEIKADLKDYYTDTVTFDFGILTNTGLIQSFLLLDNNKTFFFLISILFLISIHEKK